MTIIDATTLRSRHDTSSAYCRALAGEDDILGERMSLPMWGGYFEIFETLSFARFILQLPASAQERLRYWLDEHLRTVTPRE